MCILPLCYCRSFVVVALVIFVHDEVILSGYGRFGITFRSLSHTPILYMYKYIYKMMFVCIDGGKILFRSLQRDTLLRNSLV